MSELTVEEIKGIYNMRDMVERYGFHLNRAGFISCPFHQGDRTPSLKIYEKDYHCHACGANGDIFTFVKMIEEISFSEAFRLLGGTYQPGSQKALQARRIQYLKAKQEKKEADRQFRIWHRDRIGEVCRTLRMLDGLLPVMTPLTEEWAAAVNLREQNRYKYSILSFGDRQEQEEMRELDE